MIFVWHTFFVCIRLFHFADSCNTRFYSRPPSFHTTETMPVYASAPVYEILKNIEFVKSSFKSLDIQHTINFTNIHSNRNNIVEYQFPRNFV